VVTPNAEEVPSSELSAPTGVAVAAGDELVVVSWTAPLDDGGSPVTGYTVSAVPGVGTCATAGTSCVVTGLTNGTAYTFTVVATNAVGDSAVSEPSAPVAPDAEEMPDVTITTGYNDELYAILVDRAAYLGETPESFQILAMAVTNLLIATGGGGSFPIDPAPDITGSNEVSSTYTWEEYSEWVRTVAESLTLSEEEAEFATTYLLLFLVWLERGY
jgi:hypothetical protein